MTPCAEVVTTERLKIPRGDTWSHLVITPYIPMSNYSLRAMACTLGRKKAFDFVIGEVDQTVYPGGFLLTIPDARNLPLGDLVADFEVTDISGDEPIIKHTSQFLITVTWTATNDAN